MSDIRFTAKAYIDAGRAVVPIEAGKKSASSSWTKKTYGVSDFNRDDGIAIKCGEPSGWLVDVDCDTPEAIAAAKLLLPTTELIHGRPSKYDSHYWYTCEGIKTWQLRDVSGDMIIEIRSTNGYTVAPPSTHPSGELLSWSADRNPAIIDPPTLQRAVGSVAIVAFVLRHWSELTHESMGHLAGMFTKSDFPDFLVMEIFRAIGTLAPGNVGGEIMAFARTTLDKAKAGDPVTGGLKLQEFIGKKGVAKLRQWMKVQDAEDLEKFNEDHFIAMFGKDAVFCTEELDGLTISTPAKVRDYFKNQFVIGHKDNGDPVRKPLLEAWLESSDRRTFTKIVNKPTPLSARDGEYNLWQGFAVEPDDTKSCQLFLEHIKDNICSGNEEHYNFTMNLLALTVQEPGIPTRIAMVLRGRQGTGKGIFVNAIGALFGRRYYVHLNSADMLTGSFNNHLSGKIIVFADESFFAGDKSHVGALKRLITEPTLLIQPKFVDATMQDNHVHLFIATNEDRSYPVEPDDRRAFMPCVSPTVRPTAYYKAILEELDNGGREGLLALLQQWPVDRELLEKIPMTAEKRLQARHSMRPAHEWWMTVLYTGVLSTQRNWPTKPLTKAEIHEIFLQWCRTAGRNYPPNIVVFGREMSKFFDRIEKRTSKARMLDFGSLTDARKDWDKQMGETNWDGDSEVFELNPPF